MAGLVGLLLRGLAWIAGPLLAKILLSFGIGIATYTGLDFFLSEVSDYFVTNALSLPAEVFQVLGVFQVDVAFQMVVSAAAVRLVVGGVAGGSIKKMKLG